MSFGKPPSEGHHTSLSIFEEYPAKASRLSKKERKNIKSTARSLAETSPSDAISFLAGQRGYTNFRPDTLMGRIMSRPFDYEKLRPVGSAAFQDLLGRTVTDTEWEDAKNYASAMGVKDPYAFQSLLSERIALQNPNAIMTDADRQWQSRWGNIQTDESGNLKRGYVTFDPERFKKMASDLKSVLSSDVNISSNFSSV